MTPLPQLGSAQAAEWYDFGALTPEQQAEVDAAIARVVAQQKLCHKCGNRWMPTPEELACPWCATDAAETDERAVSGATFVLDQDASLTPRWGREGEVLWAKGESLLIVGPAGVGKTTIALQIVAGLLGVGDAAMGYPVMPAGKVLYLAMDRPAQIRRAMRRIFGEEHREALEKRLVVWPRPIPADLGKRPETLVELARRFDCDAIIIDSLKDAAVKIVDDEVGGNLNRAIQACLADGIDVLGLHHQRKGVAGNKPTTLEDVYGSTWITAGVGSVFLVWGEAGSEMVEFTHLKQPSDPVGPLKLEHDHQAGRTVVSYGWDPLAYLKMVGQAGATIADAVAAEHGAAAMTDAKRKKTERKLKGLERRGLARQEGQERGEGGRMASARWFAIDPDEVQIHRGHAEDTSEETAGQSHRHVSDEKGTETPGTKTAPDRGYTVDADDKEAGQTMDATVDTVDAAPTVDMFVPTFRWVQTEGSRPDETEPEDDVEGDQSRSAKMAQHGTEAWSPKPNFEAGTETGPLRPEEDADTEGNPFGGGVAA